MCFESLFGSGGSSGPSWESPDRNLVNNLIMGSILSMMPQQALRPMLGSSDSGLEQMLSRMYGGGGGAPRQYSGIGSGMPMPMTSPMLGARQKGGDDRAAGSANLQRIQAFAPSPMQYQPGAYGYNIFGGGGKPGILGTTPAYGQYNILGR